MKIPSLSIRETFSDKNVRENLYDIVVESLLLTCLSQHGLEQKYNSFMKNLMKVWKKGSSLTESTARVHVVKDLRRRNWPFFEMLSRTAVHFIQMTESLLLYQYLRTKVTQMAQKNVPWIDSPSRHTTFIVEMIEKYKFIIESNLEANTLDTYPVDLVLQKLSKWLAFYKVDRRLIFPQF